MTIGIIREGKIPPDSRTPLTPEQCLRAKALFGLDIIVQPSPHRCFSDDEYRRLGIVVSEDLTPCDILFGVKEVPINQLIAGKTYLFFSHTIKKQAYNRKLLMAILEKRIRLIDYEVLTDEKGQRVIAFGKFAGMVGAHNAVWTWQRRKNLSPTLPRMYTFPHYEDAVQWYRQYLQLPAVKIVLTGTGRVANGAAQVLEDMGIQRVTAQAFLESTFDRAVFAQLSSKEYVRRKDGAPFDKETFYRQPALFESAFLPFAHKAQIFINGIYWDPRAPAFFTLEEMCDDAFSIEVIADVTCDIAPAASVPSTIRPSTIADPVYGFDPCKGVEVPRHTAGTVDVMAIDNLPNELPRDASESFGERLIEHVLPELMNPQSEMIRRGTVAIEGQLGPCFQYLSDFVEAGNSIS
ncbi:MAG: alanine dehydrogenase [Saprospiraceae bacterium]|nr:MAG: alanine dehydrogenase [Saprospiraceae bacterium]